MADIVPLKVCPFYMIVLEICNLMLLCAALLKFISLKFKTSLLNMFEYNMQTVFWIPENKLRGVCVMLTHMGD